MANTFVGSAFGFVFWLFAAHSYNSSQVGLGAAYLSSLVFLTTLADLGFSTAVIRFAPAMKEDQRAFINSVVWSVIASTLVVCAVFALGTPLWSPEMREISRLGLASLIFIGTGVLVEAAQLLDRVFVAFEASSFMFIRNLVANVLRVGLLVSVCRLFGVSGLVLSLGGASAATFLLSAFVLVPRAVPGFRIRPAFALRVLRGKITYTLGNHLASLLWSAPSIIYPLVIVDLLGASANAHFYVSWMVANLLFIVPTSISVSTLARSANAGHLDHGSFRRTIWFTIAGLLGPAACLMALGPFVLRAFGHEYGVNADLLLFALLVLSVFPYTVNTFVITYHRIKPNTARLVVVAGLITLLCLTLSVALGAVYGLPGVGIGWLSGQLLGVIVALWSCYGPVEAGTHLISGLQPGME